MSVLLILLVFFFLFHSFVLYSFITFLKYLLFQRVAFTWIEKAQLNTTTFRSIRNIQSKAEQGNESRRKGEKKTVVNANVCTKRKSKRILRLNGRKRKKKEAQLSNEMKSIRAFRREKKCDAVVVNSEQWTVCALSKTSQLTQLHCFYPSLHWIVWWIYRKKKTSRRSVVCCKCWKKNSSIKKRSQWTKT